MLQRISNVNANKEPYKVHIFEASCAVLSSLLYIAWNQNPPKKTAWSAQVKHAGAVTRKALRVGNNTTYYEDS
nr:hypothetical protein [uncultured Draconibacterium sp.]